MSKAAISIQSLTKTFSVGAFLRILMKHPPGRGAAEVFRGISIRASKRVKVPVPCLWYSPCGLHIAAEEWTERWTE